MKILYVIPNLNVGGVSKIVTELATGMAEKKYEVIILTLNKHEKQVFVYQSIKIIELNIQSKSALFSGISKLINIINFEKPDIVHSHTIYSHLFVRAATLFCKKPKYIASEHGTMNKMLSNDLGFKLMKNTNFLSDLITNVSQASVDSYIQYKIVNKNKMTCQYNGIDLDKFNNIKKTYNLNKILYVGRISKEKNLHLLIDFMKLLPNDIYHCDIVGDGDQLEVIKQYVKAQKIENRVTFLGRQLDIPSIMKKYDILILTSFTEGLPTVLIEAIASRLLVLSTDCGGVKEILEDSDFLVVKNNNKEDLLNKYLNLKNMDLNMISENLHKKVKNDFSKQNMICNWESVYKNIL